MVKRGLGQLGVYKCTLKKLYEFRAINNMIENHETMLDDEIHTSDNDVAASPSISSAGASASWLQASMACAYQAERVRRGVLLTPPTHSPSLSPLLSSPSCSASLCGRLRPLACETHSRGRRAAHRWGAAPNA